MIKLKELSKPRNIALIALLIAANIGVSMLSVHTETLKLSFSFIIIAFSAYFFGPVAAALVGGLGDIASALIFPVGPYFPGFTLTAVLTGICFGVFLYEKTSIAKISISVILNEFLGSLLLNSMWISILYSIPFKPLLISRLTTQILPMTVIEIVTLWLLFGKSMVIDNIKKAILSKRK
ncbi:MAG: folate family ECF transporter S component [Clostridia bacterium]|nr:folate family ECF transporter S component [Clostridia bacterium]